MAWNRRLVMVSVGACVGACGLSACSVAPKAHGGKAEVVEKAAPTQQAALLDRVKSLAGVWEMTDEKGQRQVATVFSVSSNGSVVREIMFPASDHEMTNMYTMHGGELRVTHYCAVGNQPHMRARHGGADRIEFKFDSVSNLTSLDQTYMGEMTLVFVDHDNIRQEWRSFKNGVLSDHNVNFELTRRKTP